MVKQMATINIENAHEPDAIIMIGRAPVNRDDTKNSKIKWTILKRVDLVSSIAGKQSVNCKASLCCALKDNERQDKNEKNKIDSNSEFFNKNCYVLRSWKIIFTVSEPYLLITVQVYVP